MIKQRSGLPVQAFQLQLQHSDVAETGSLELLGKDCVCRPASSWFSDYFSKGRFDFVPLKDAGRNLA